MNTQHVQTCAGVLDLRSRPQGIALVIDDDAWIRSVIAEFLAEQGYTVEQAADGSAGLHMAEQVQPDVILLDLALPMRAGLDVLHRLKERRPTRDIPIIIVSAYAMLVVGDPVVHADHQLKEPLDLKALLDRVNQVVKEAHPRFRLLPPIS